MLKEIFEKVKGKKLIFNFDDYFEDCDRYDWDERKKFVKELWDLFGEVEFHTKKGNFVLGFDYDFYGEGFEIDYDSIEVIDEEGDVVPNPFTPKEIEKMIIAVLEDEKIVGDCYLERNDFKNNYVIKI